MTERPYFTLAEVVERRAEEDRLQLEMPIGYTLLAPALVERFINGVGPDAFPSPVRRLLSVLVWYGDLPADIHDYRFRMSDGSEAGFHYANAEWLRNCRRVIRDRRIAWNPDRYAAFWRAWLDYRVLESPAGWKAWLNAAARYHQKPITLAE